MRFDLLGFRFSPEGLSVAEKTIEKFLARAVRLYEQEQGEPFGFPLLGLYVRRWVRFATSCGRLRMLCRNFSGVPLPCLNATCVGDGHEEGQLRMWARPSRPARDSPSLGVMGVATGARSRRS